MDELFRQTKYMGLIQARDKLLEKMKLEEDVLKIEKKEGTSDLHGIDYWRFQVDVTEQKIRAATDRKESAIANIERQIQALTDKKAAIISSAEQNIQDKSVWLEKCRSVLESFEKLTPKTKTYSKMKAQVEQLAKEIEIWRPVAAGGLPIPPARPANPGGVPPSDSGKTEGSPGTVPVRRNEKGKILPKGVAPRSAPSVQIAAPPPPPPPIEQPAEPREYDPSQEPTNEAEFEIWLAAKRAAAEERQKKELDTFYSATAEEPPAQNVISNTKKRVMKVVKK